MPDIQSGNTAVLAMCGKGGVGKTSLSATIVKILSSNPANKVLAIDADPAVGLSTALGIEVSKTVDDIRNELIRCWYVFYKGEGLHIPDWNVFNESERKGIHIPELNYAEIMVFIHARDHQLVRIVNWYGGRI